MDGNTDDVAPDSGKDLYFLPLIADAYARADHYTAFVHTFRQIAELGRRATHRCGLEQFHQFMLGAARGVRMTFVVFRDGNELGRLAVEPAGALAVLPAITPGDYTVCLDTGREVWRRRLAQSDLVWAEAFPSAPLDVAAATEEARQGCTRREALFGGEVLLNVFAGVEAGQIGIEMQ